MPESECLWCDRAWALLGLVAGVGISFMAIDLLSGGALTRSLTRGARLASVTTLPVAGDAS